MIYYHRIGTSQCIIPLPFSSHSLFKTLILAEDILVHEDKENPEWMFGAEVTEDGKYVALYTMKDTSRVSPEPLDD
jgi:prolyl oligopeptidase